MSSVGPRCIDFCSLFVICVVLLVFHACPSVSRPLCSDHLVGFAAVPGYGLTTTTGGGNAEPQTVTTLKELESLAGDSVPRVLRIQGTIVGGAYAIDISSNKTIMGVDKSATIRGGVNIKAGNSNIIVRNLNIQGVHPNRGADDTVAARGAHHLWFDHLNIWDAGDGLMDLTLGSDFITVSNNKFWYTNASHRHRFASLVSSGADHDDTDAGKMRVTYHHNWWAELVDQRMPRILYGNGHVYNNYYASKGNLYCIGVGSLGSVLVENNYFKDVKSPHKFMYDRPATITARGNVYQNTIGDQKSGSSGTGPAVAAFEKPPYAYQPHAAEDIPELVTRCAGPVLSQ